MRRLLPFFFFALLFPESARAEPSEVLGLDLCQVDREVVIAGVMPHSRAARAGVLVGQRLSAIDGHPIETLDDVRVALEAHERGSPFALTVDERWWSAPLPQHRQRIGLRPFGYALTGEARVLAAWLGLNYDFHIWGGLWLSAGLGYVPLGRKPFVDGLNVITGLVGIELEQPIYDRFSAFGRTLIGPNLKVSGAANYQVEPLMVAFQLGGRFSLFELFLSGGFGPARDFNFGGGLGVSFSFDPEQVSVERW